MQQQWAFLSVLAAIRAVCSWSASVPASYSNYEEDATSIIAISRFRFAVHFNVVFLTRQLRLWWIPLNRLRYRNSNGFPMIQRPTVNSSIPRFLYYIKALRIKFSDEFVQPLRIDRIQRNKQSHGGKCCTSSVIIRFFSDGKIDAALDPCLLFSSELLLGFRELG